MLGRTEYNEDAVDNMRRYVEIGTDILLFDVVPQQVVNKTFAHIANQIGQLLIEKNVRINDVGYLMYCIKEWVENNDDQLGTDEHLRNNLKTVVDQASDAFHFITHPGVEQ